MTDTEAERAATLALTNQYLALFAQKDWAGFAALWAEDGVLEFPYAPPGRRSRYVGKADIVAYMQGVSGRMTAGGLQYYDVHPMLDPAKVCIEMGLSGTIVATGLPIAQRYVSIVETKGGRIWRYREYWNPIASMDANGGRDAWTAAFGSPETAP